MEIKGTIKSIGQIINHSFEFSTRELVVTTQEQYPQDIPIKFVKDKCSVLDQYKQGDLVEVGVNLRGNEYNGKHYVSLNGWKISKV